MLFETLTLQFAHLTALRASMDEKRLECIMIYNESTDLTPY